MKKFYLLLVGVLMTLSTSFAQSGAVKGRIMDKETGEALIGASVLIKGTTQGATTDVNGDFVMQNVPVGKQTFVISYIGYEKYETTINVVAGRVMRLPTLKLDPQAMGLKEVQVLASFQDDKRQQPTPISTISALDIKEKMGAQEFPEMLKSTPGVFVSTGGGSFGGSSVRIRGFGSENTAVLINGIPVNDMESGRVFWSNWGGMNDVTRNQQVQRGLGASKLAVSSVGGTINIITKPTEFRKGVRVSYGMSNRSWKHRAMVSASTGLMKGDWAVTVLGSTRQGEGFRYGTSANSWAYFLSAYKGFGKNHQLIFTAFGAPQTTERGRNATLESYQTVGDERYNPAWGFRDGKRFSSSRNSYHKPKFMLNHYWDISPKTTLSTSVYYSFGRGGGTGFNRTAGVNNPVPFNVTAGTDESAFQVDWAGIIAQNKAVTESTFITGTNNTAVTGKASQYILQESRNDHNWLGALTTLNSHITDDLSVTFGLDYRWYRGFHYQTVNDLLGGDFWLDRERFNDQPDNNLLNPNFLAKEGDRIGYDYTGTVGWLGTFGQVEYSLGNLDLFLTGTVVQSQFQRNGKFLHEEFLDSSLGKSELHQFTNFTVKAGANYKITGRHNVFFNSGFFNRAPFFRDSFVDARVSNTIRGGLNNEEILSLEAGYGYRSPTFAANLNVYQTYWQNRTRTFGTFASYIDPSSGEFVEDFVNVRMTGVGALHRGIEFDFLWQMLPALTLKGMASIGDWRWMGNAKATIFTDPGLQIVNDNQTVYSDRLKVGGSAQSVAALNLNYRSPKYWYAGVSYNFYDNMYADYNPIDKTNSEAYFNQVDRLNNAFTFDLYGGKSFKIKKGLILQVKFNVNNIFDNRFVIDSNQRTASFSDPNPSPFVQYYFGRTFFLSTVLQIR